MPHRELLGRTVRLPVRRFGSPGAFLALEPTDAVILLPGVEVPEGTKEKDEIEVFIHLDSEDRPIATTRRPKLELGEVAFLECTDVAEFGAFVDWGLMKELLVPLAEQTRDVRVGDRHPIGLIVDKTGRLAGTMRVSEMLRAKGDFELDEWVDGEAWRDEPNLGLFVILERAYLGLVPATEVHGLSRGDSARFRVTNILADGKLELSLRGPAHTELENDARRILEKLALPGTPRVGDRSSPEEIRAIFGLSKKAFKRAAGRLLKERAASVGPDGWLTISSSRSASPGPRRRPSH